MERGRPARILSIWDCDYLFYINFQTPDAVVRRQAVAGAGSISAQAKRDSTADLSRDIVKII